MARLCATRGCDHLDCYGSPFLVVLVACDHFYCHGSLGFADIRGSQLCLWLRNVDMELIMVCVSVIMTFPDLSAREWSLSVDSIERNYLRSIWHELHELCCDPGRNFTGSFRQRHWREPLVQAAFVVTFCFFVFQLLQVILTLIPLYKSTKAAVESNK
ncbi:hypothetical protein C2845_PM03G34340 [Panicum miliaceum]|uniref:Uncharacterized protein n=1 Tax=Panicum miliaceum TaxID=4540 RepID=A0A3L6T4H2_PANMI|nr:hypothetical protein C2845_PM03G34340 [Panicum miliaceum]